MAIRNISRYDTQGQADNLPWGVPMEDWPTEILRDCIQKVDESFFPLTISKARTILRSR